MGWKLEDSAYTLAGPDWLEGKGKSWRVGVLDVLIALWVDDESEHVLWNGLWAGG